MTEVRNGEGDISNVQDADWCLTEEGVGIRLQLLSIRIQSQQLEAEPGPSGMSS